MQLGIHLYVQPLIDLSISLDKWDSKEPFLLCEAQFALLSGLLLFFQEEGIEIYQWYFND